MILASLPFQATQEVALHGGRADALSPAQTTPVDAVQVRNPRSSGVTLYRSGNKAEDLGGPVLRFATS